MKAHSYRLSWLSLSFVAFSFTELVSQNYFIVDGKDSVLCNQINFFDTNAQGKLIDFELCK
jgi:hypothetical protein